MARLRVALTTPIGSEIALSAGTARTIMQAVAPSNQIIACKGFSVSFDGVVATAEPVLVEVLFQTTSGTLSAATLRKENHRSGSETVQTTGGTGATSEPTPGDVMRTYNIHPQTGIERSIAFDEEIEIAGGERLGIRCTAPSNVNAAGSMHFEE